MVLWMAYRYAGLAGRYWKRHATWCPQTWLDIFWTKWKFVSCSWEHHLEQERLPLTLPHLTTRGYCLWHPLTSCLANSLGQPKSMRPCAANMGCPPSRLILRDAKNSCDSTAAVSGMKKTPYPISKYCFVWRVSPFVDDLNGDWYNPPVKKKQTFNTCHWYHIIV